MSVELTPVLPPEELKGLLAGEVLLDGVVHSLDQHVGQTGLFQEVGLGGRVSERVHSPASLGFHS